ncbi:MAG: type II secretion system protein [Planctomycetota bacterium]
MLPTGFTLMELLVVIAIIALLMSILMLVASSVKQQAKAVICQSNLHQWGFVMNLYTEDYDGFLMPDLCHEKYAALGNLPCSYGINSWVLSKPCASGTDALGGALLWKTPDVRGAVNVPMVLDCAGYENATLWHYDEPPEYNRHWVQGNSEHEMRYVCLDRHNEHVNGVFWDFGVRKAGLK